MRVRAELAALLADTADAGERDLLAAYAHIEEVAKRLGENADDSQLLLAVIQEQATQLQAARARLRRVIAYARECSTPGVRLVDVAASSGISKSHVGRYYDQDVVKDVWRRVGGDSDRQDHEDPRRAVRQLLRRRRAGSSRRR